MFTGARQVSSGFVEFACVQSSAPRGRSVHSSSGGFTQARLGVVGDIRFRVVSFVHA